MGRYIHFVDLVFIHPRCAGEAHKKILLSTLFKPNGMSIALCRRTLGLVSGTGAFGWAGAGHRNFTRSPYGVFYGS